MLASLGRGRVQLVAVAALIAGLSLVLLQPTVRNPAAQSTATAVVVPSSPPWDPPRDPPSSPRVEAEPEPAPLLVSAEEDPLPKSLSSAAFVAPRGAFSCGAWEDQYAALHARILSNQAPRKYLVYVCDGGLCGGHGDRLHGCVQLLLFSLLSDRALVVHWFKGGDVSVMYSPNRVRWDAQIPGDLTACTFVH
jgi:hypothetical protein